MNTESRRLVFACGMAGPILAILISCLTVSCENSITDTPAPDLSIYGMSPTDGATITETSPVLSWNLVNGAVTYEIQIADLEAEVQTATPVIINAPDTEYTISPALTKGDFCYWRVRARGNNDYGNWSAVFSFEIVYAIGETGPAGGIVFYDKGSYSDGWRYLEASTVNQGTSNVWGGFNTLVGGTSTSIGSGESNTAAIVASFGDSEPWQDLTNYAAKICSDLDTGGGYNDWFLPSKDELAEMYAQRDLIGGFSIYSFWSSSEYDSQSAWYHYFNSNLQNTAEQYHTMRVRACRAF